MIRSLIVLAFVADALVATPAFAREFCTGDSCVPDVLEVHFDTPGGEPRKMDLNIGDTFTVWLVVPEVFSEIAAFSFGVAMEMDKLRFVSGVISDEVDALNPFFSNLSAAVGKGDDVNDDPANDPRRFGFVATALFPVLPTTVLPLGATDFPLCSATFEVIGELSGTTPSILEVSSELVPNPGAPATMVNFSVAGNSVSPTDVIDGEAFGGEAPPECMDEWAFYFGADPDADPHAVANDSFVISMRNEIDALGCSLGVKIDGTSLSFRDRELGRDVAGDIRLVDLIITDNDGNTQTPEKNEATGPGGAAVATAVDLSTDLQAISDSFFQVNLNPNVGGPGFTIAFAADVSGSGATIPATSPTPPCTVNELFVVTLGTDTPDANFSRADVNGDDRLNITDGAVMAQNIFFNRLKAFDCDDMLDANDDGMLDMSDPVAFLMWAFAGTANLASPFVGECGQDSTGTDSLGCNESNCGA